MQSPVPAGACGSGLRALGRGSDGRSVIDRLCREVAARLAPGGALLLVQSHLAGIEPTLALLRRHALRTRVVAEHVGPLGPIARARLRYLDHLLDGSCQERLVVIEATRLR